MKHNLAVNRKELPMYATMWLNLLLYFMPSKRIQTKKVHTVLFHYEVLWQAEETNNDKNQSNDLPEA